MNKYQPSNGTEGEWFMDKFCFQCERDKIWEDPCEMLGRTMALDVDDPRYPEEWTYDSEGNPVCTAFTPIGEDVDKTAYNMKRREAAGQMRLFDRLVDTIDCIPEKEDAEFLRTSNQEHKGPRSEGVG